MTGMPPLDWQRAPCPTCGATTVAEAERMCKPQSDETGEVDCAGSEREDAEGYLLQPTAASIAAVDAWCDEDVKADLDRAIRTICCYVGLDPDTDGQRLLDAAKALRQSN